MNPFCIHFDNSIIANYQKKIFIIKSLLTSKCR